MLGITAALFALAALASDSGAPKSPREFPAYERLRARLGELSGYRDDTYFPGSDGSPSIPLTDAILRALDGLRIVPVTDSALLSDPGDKGVVVLPYGGTNKVERLALQLVKTGELRVQSGRLAKMKDDDVAALFLHEALIRLWYLDPTNVAGGAYLKSTERIADVVHVTFLHSRLVPDVSAKALAGKLCETGIRASSLKLRGWKRLPLPSAEHRKPPMPKEFLQYINVNCLVRRFETKGPWITEELKNADAYEIGELPGLSDTPPPEPPPVPFLHELRTGNFWIWWLLPSRGDAMSKNMIQQWGKPKHARRNVTGYLDRLPTLEHLSHLGHPELVSKGDLIFLHGGDFDSLWVESEKHHMIDGGHFGFSLWGK